MIESFQDSEGSGKSSKSLAVLPKDLEFLSDLPVTTSRLRHSVVSARSAPDPTVCSRPCRLGRGPRVVRMGR